MSKEVDREAANWTKAISGLAITKCGLISAIKNKLKHFLKSFPPEERDHLSEFFENIQASYFEFKTENGKVYWKISNGCTDSGLCQKIVDRLFKKHVNKSKNIAWNPMVEEIKLYTLNKKKTTLPYVCFFNEKCSICGEINCPFERNRRGVPLFDDTQQNEDVDKYYWQIANKYMFRGNEKNNFPNTGPEDTDPQLIFKLMKNCKLFLLDDNSIYDELLEVRNLLMHNPESRLTDEAFEECFKRMESILRLSLFSNEYSEKAISELGELKGMRIIMTSLTAEQTAIVQRAFKLQQHSVKFDIHFSGSLKNDYVLEGIMKASKENRRKYTKYAGQTQVPPSQTPERPTESPVPSRRPSPVPSRRPSPVPSRRRENTGVAPGATAGAVIGAIGGPAGSIVGAAIGGFLGKMFD